MIPIKIFLFPKWKHFTFSSGFMKTKYLMHSFTVLRSGGDRGNGVF